MAILIQVDGTLSEISKAEVNDIQNWQKWLGDWAENVTFMCPVAYAGKTYAGMLVAEHGKLNGLPMNAVATSIFVAGGYANDVIVGPAIVYSKNEIE